MKLLKSTVLFVFACLLLNTSCKKDKKNDPSYKCEACATTPEAIAANDNSSKEFTKASSLVHQAPLNSPDEWRFLHFCRDDH